MSKHVGAFKPIPVKDYKLWDKTLSMFTNGTFPDGRPIPHQGMSPMKTGFWTGQGLTPMAHLSGLKWDCAVEYLNWYNSGWQGAFIAKEGYYSPVPETAKKFLTQAEWDYWYDGKPAAVDMMDP
jgi:hypothetical protein